MPRSLDSSLAQHALLGLDLVWNLPWHIFASLASRAAATFLSLLLALHPAVL